jgi:hypothetical protein
MKRATLKYRAGVAAAAAVLLLAVVVGVAAAAGEAPFDVKRLAVCEAVENREPVGISDTFSADTAKVYVFLEAANIAADTEIDFVWFHGGNEMLRVPLMVRQGSRWRTYANKNLYGLTGTWRVEIQDKENNVIGSVQFEVK